MEGVIEDDDGGPAGGGTGVLDGVLDGLAAGVEQGGALGVGARGEPVQRLGDFDVGLVGRGEEAGVGVFGELRGRPFDDARGGVADRGDGDAGAEVDERVAVDIDEHPAPGGRGVDAGGAGEARRERGMAAGGEFARARAR